MVEFEHFAIVCLWRTAATVAMEPTGWVAGMKRNLLDA